LEVSLFRAAGGVDGDEKAGTKGVGGGVNDRTGKGQSALILASKNGHQHVAKWLLNIGGADFTYQDSSGYSALVEAAWGGYPSICEALLAKDADVNNTGGSVSPLEQAVKAGHDNVAAVLRRGGAKELRNNKYKEEERRPSQAGDVLGLLNEMVQQGVQQTEAKEFFTSVGVNTALAKKLISNGYDSWTTLSLKIKDPRSGVRELIRHGFSEGEAKKLASAVEARQAKLDISFLQLLSSQEPLDDKLSVRILEKGKKILEAGAQVNCVDKLGWTPLLHCTQQGHRDMVMHLLKMKANPDQRNLDGATALLWGAGKGRQEIVSHIILSKADMNLGDNLGRTPLGAASANGYATTTEILLQAGADVDMQTGNKTTALMLAALNGHVAVADCLVKRKASLDLQDVMGATALLSAVKSGSKSVGIVKALIEGNASLDVADRKGETAGMIAMRSEDRYVASLLINAGASSVPPEADLPRDGGDEGYPLHYQARRSHDATEVSLLLSENPQLAFRRDHDGYLPLHRAAQNQGPNSARILEILLGANREAVSIKVPDGRTALHFAAEGGKESEVISILLAAYPEGARVYDDSRNLPLHLACRNRDRASLSIVKALLNENPQSIRERSGQALLQLPIHIASEEGIDVVLVKELIKEYKHGLFERDGRGNLPLAAACRNNMGQGMNIFKTLYAMNPNAIKERMQDGASCFHIAARFSDSASFVLHVQKCYPEALKMKTTPIQGGVGEGGRNASLGRTWDQTQGDDGDLPLHWASRNVTSSSLPIVAKLLDMYKAAVSLPGCGGNYPLHVASKESMSPEVIKLLADAYEKAISIPNREGDLPAALAVLNHHDSVDTGVLMACASTTEQEGSAFIPLWLSRGVEHDENEGHVAARYQYSAAKNQAEAERIMRGVAMQWRHREMVESHSTWKHRWLDYKLNKPDFRTLGLAAGQSLVLKGYSVEEAADAAAKEALTQRATPNEAASVAGEMAGLAVTGSIQSDVGRTAGTVAASAIIAARGCLSDAYKGCVRASIKAAAGEGGLDADDEEAIEAGKAAGVEVVKRMLEDVGAAAAEASRASGATPQQMAAYAGAAVEQAGGSAIDAALAANKAALAGKASRSEAQKLAGKAAEIAVMRGEQSALSVCIKAADREAVDQLVLVEEERIMVKRMIESPAKQIKKDALKMMQRKAELKKEEADALRASQLGLSGQGPQYKEASAAAAAVTCLPDPAKAVGFAVAVAILKTGGSIGEALERAEEAAQAALGTGDTTNGQAAKDIVMEAKASLERLQGEEDLNILSEYLREMADQTDKAVEEHGGSALAQTAYSGATVLRGGGSALEVGACAAIAAEDEEPDDMHRGSGLAAGNIVIAKGGSISWAGMTCFMAAIACGATKRRAASIAKELLELTGEGPGGTAATFVESDDSTAVEAAAAAAEAVDQVLFVAGRVAGETAREMKRTGKIQAEAAAIAVEEAGGSPKEASTAASEAALAAGMNEIEVQHAAGLAGGTVECLRGGSPAECGHEAMKAALAAGASQEVSAVVAGEAAGTASVMQMSSLERHPAVAVGLKVLMDGGSVEEVSKAAEEAALKEGANDEEAHQVGADAAGSAVVEKLIQEAGRAASDATKRAGGSVEMQCVAAGAAVGRGGGSAVEAGIISAKVAIAEGMKPEPAQRTAGRAAGAAVVAKGGTAKEAGSAAGLAAIAMEASREFAAKIAGEVAENSMRDPGIDVEGMQNQSTVPVKTLKQATSRSVATEPKRIRARKNAAIDGGSIIQAALQAAKRAEISAAQANLYISK